MSVDLATSVRPVGFMRLIKLDLEKWLDNIYLTGETSIAIG